MTKSYNYFKEGQLTKMGAPMVRYSKLPFRRLILSYGADVAFSPMILADSFVSSPEARFNEFTTDPLRDRPLIVQFASKSVDDFVSAAQLVAPHAEGVDLDCGCPQGWAIREGIGAALLQRPEFISDVVRSTKNRTQHSLSVSVKIRLQKDHRRTWDLVKGRLNPGRGESFIILNQGTVDRNSLDFYLIYFGS
uniref:tRNA-dihydrouridine synthase 4-like n=1 Tax=Caligus clemensi TaxID=344056 RepID=C1C0M5_CALCM|nr:tRNA-dihydrouridine synthase 4-like [Caligus clemensi]